MREALQTFNDGLPRNPAVRLTSKGGGWIGLSPLGAQSEPQNVVALKDELTQMWPMTSLLDMLKETDLRLNFTDALRSVRPMRTLTATFCGRACCFVCMGSAPTLGCSA